MKTLQHFPFPERNTNFQDNEIYFIKSNLKEHVTYYYERNIEKESILIANQYFTVESILLNALDYVFPVIENKSTSSAKFATVIRESSNLFEIISRKTYCQFFIVPENRELNINNYLSLENYLNLSKEKLLSPLLNNFYGGDKLIEPFEELKDWDRISGLEKTNIPKWWIAYNKIKHDTSGLTKYATLENAILALSGIFILIKKVYGNGLITNYLHKPIFKGNIQSDVISIRSSSIFSGEILKAIRK